MEMWEIRKYTTEDKEAWNAFVAASRNATFLFERGYMDYHADRFTDCSLMAFRKGKLCALLPANIDGNTLHTHQGLTYGGWIWPPSGLDTTDIFRLWKGWLDYCRLNGIETVVYKPLPYIYAKMPSEEDRYMLFLCGARLIQTDISTTLDLWNSPGFDKLQKRHLKKAAQEVEIKVHDGMEPFEVEEFHSLLTACLAERHQTRPVHSLEELKTLAGRFKERIRIWRANKRVSNDLLAAVCVYETETCIHCQYIATSRQGRELNVLSALFKVMIEHYDRRVFDNPIIRYFDFGTSNEKGGRLLNAGLNRQKTSYGGSGVAYQRYEISVADALVSMPSELWQPR